MFFIESENIILKRVYDEPSESDGFRILIDRLWPRGVKKEEAFLDKWLKEVAPSPELRKWFSHKPERFIEFTEKYKQELRNSPEKRQAVELLKELVREKKRVTFLFAAKDKKHNHAVVLREELMDQ